MAFRRLTPQQIEAKRMKKDLKNPSLWKRVKYGAMVGAVGAGLAASQGPAARNTWESTRNSMRVGAETALKAQLPFKDKALVEVGLKKGPVVNVGEGWRTYRGADGTLYIGKPDVAVQAVKNFRPSVQLTPQGAKTAGKAALVGAAAGVTLGAASWGRKKVRYVRAVRKASSR